MILKREERETEGDEVKKKVKQLDGSHFHAEKKTEPKLKEQNKSINKVVNRIQNQMNGESQQDFKMKR